MVIYHYGHASIIMKYILYYLLFSSLVQDIFKRLFFTSCKMNCVHLENCLHEAREDAHTNLCAADRRASEYNALRLKAVKMHSLFERFRSCVTSGAAVSFADSFRSLALSLARYLLIIELPLLTISPLIVFHV